jgi:gliding motility-associated-like protein
MKMKLAILTLLIAVSQTVTNAQLVVNNTTLTPAQLVQNVLLGTGVTVSNITYNGSAVNANTVQNSAGAFNGSSSNVGLTSGVILGSGDVQVAEGPNNNTGASLGGGFILGTDPDLAAITPNQIYDEAILEFDFVPQGDSIKFRYVFASEEYDEYVCGTVNDAFGFFISGPGFAGPFSNGGMNIALIPGTSTPVSINTVNLGVSGTNGIATNCTAIDPNWASYNIYYTQNTQQTIQYDGKTVVLTAYAAVQCGQTYHIKLAIGDAGDGAWDSGVFLEGGSFSSDAVQVNVTTVNGDTNLVEGCLPALFSFIRPNDDTYLVIHYDITGTATNGSDYNQIADSVVFQIGIDTVQITLTTIDDDGTAGLEVPESIIITAYTINQCGDTVISVGEVWIIEPPELIFANNDIVLTCPQTSINITASVSGGIPGYSYTWDVGGASSTISVPGNANGFYIVTATDTCGLRFASDTIFVSINQPPPPNVNIIEDSVYGCGSITLTSSVTNGASPISYDWSTGANSQNLNFIPSIEGYVYLNVTDFCGEISNTDSVYIEMPDPIITSTSDTSIICPGDDVNIMVIASSGTPGYTYSWNSGGNNDTILVSPFITTNYIVTVTDNCSITAVDTVVVTVPIYQPLTITLSGDTLMCQGLEGDLNAVSTGGTGGNSYYWDNIGNGVLNYNSSFASVTLLAPGYVIVTAEDNCGNLATDSIHINLEVCDLIIPNVFSPNGDGQNDLFVITGLENFPNTHLTVFNRWGTIVYNNENYQNNWNGSECSDGTYYYIVNPNDERIEKSSGYLTVLREK